MNNKVLVLLASYNGEKYIQQQIDSIIKQTYCDWELLIRDDGSSDNTIGIIEEYCISHSNISLIMGKNIGVTKNFEQLLLNAGGYRYVMLCDQDDVWFPNKIEQCIQKMHELEDSCPGNPLLLYTDKVAVDASLKRINHKEVTFHDTLWSLLTANHIYGCTMMLNNELVKKVLPIPEYVYIHDYWISLVAAMRGQIYHLNVESMFYRQHSGNVTGGENNYSIRNKVKQWNKVNANIKKNIIQNYNFCKTIGKDNTFVGNYIKIVESGKFLKIYYAVKYRLFSYGILQTLRLYWVLVNVNGKALKKIYAKGN